jgi:acetyl-CoA carboxylase carboxyl transferase subunit beta
LEKIFKRIPRIGTEQDQAKRDLKEQPQATSKNPPDNSKPRDDGPIPKFSWSIKPQRTSGEGNKNSTLIDKEVPDRLWIKCEQCKEPLYSKEFEHNNKVCPKCGYHFRLGAWERLALLLDEGSMEELNRELVTADPLQFVSLAEASYQQKSAETRQKTGLNEAILTVVGRLKNMPIAVAVCDFAYQGGSMGSAFGEKLVRLIETALAQKMPLLTVSASGGARMQEGMFSLMQMTKTTAALAKLGEAGLPHISLLTDPCTGGVIASYATVADVIIAEPGALLGFAGPRIIEQITKQKLPPGFQTAEFLLEHGMLDRVVSRKELRPLLEHLLSFYHLAYSRFKTPQKEREVSYAGK